MLPPIMHFFKTKWHYFNHCWPCISYMQQSSDTQPTCPPLFSCLKKEDSNIKIPEIAKAPPADAGLNTDDKG